VSEGLRRILILCAYRLRRIRFEAGAYNIGVPSILSTEQEEERYSVGDALVDAAVGILILIPVIPLALSLGGFSFIEPWLIMIPLMAFAGGVVRGRGAGNIWLKAALMNLVVLLYLVSRGDIREMAVGALLTVIPSSGAIALRRHFSRQ
jgi:hypothetical protein